MVALGPAGAASRTMTGVHEQHRGTAADVDRIQDASKRVLRPIKPVVVAPYEARGFLTCRAIKPLKL